MKPVIRELSGARRPAFLALASEYLPGSDPGRMAEMAARFPRAFLTAEDVEGGDLLGIAFGWMRPGAEDEFSLDGIAVPVPFQRRGVGSLLLAAFERSAVLYGARVVSVGSAEGGAERFYLRNGYRPVRFRAMADGAPVTLRDDASHADYETWPRPCAGFVVMEKKVR